MPETLAVRRVSATPNAFIPLDALRSNAPEYSKLVDISRCIGCKGCEVACKEWNDLKVEPTANFGSYQSHQDLDLEYVALDAVQRGRGRRKRCSG